ncbi:TetR/AcrR family transcriptional regulator [Microbacterium awajiense]|uniref:TetR/AcrR family transcriptional regulator n=1 Tax=Microbacterium awajiense TaxID=415214 RepID=A0ABP7A1S6_9MICO
MRADAVANREKLLDAASELFADAGIEAPMHLIAERADVGVGTLYRHFEDRDAVIIGLCTRLLGRFNEAGRLAADQPTGWDAIVTYIDATTAMYFDFRWLADAIERVRQITPGDVQAESEVEAQVARAKDEGTLRPDVTVIDLSLIPPMLGALVRLPEPVRAMMLARQRSLILDALRPEGAERPAIGGYPVTIQEFQRHIGRPGA